MRKTIYFKREIELPGWPDFTGSRDAIDGIQHRYDKLAKGDLVNLKPRFEWLRVKWKIK